VSCVPLGRIIDDEGTDTFVGWGGAELSIAAFEMVRMAVPTL
jgi:hypothetical protein